MPQAWLILLRTWPPKCWNYRSYSPFSATAVAWHLVDLILPLFSSLIADSVNFYLKGFNAYDFFSREKINLNINIHSIFFLNKTNHTMEWNATRRQNDTRWFSVLACSYRISYALSQYVIWLINMKFIWFSINDQLLIWYETTNVQKFQ